MIPFNFLVKKAGYLNTGVWAKKAMKEAKLFGEVVEVGSLVKDFKVGDRVIIPAITPDWSAFPQMSF